MIAFACMAAAAPASAQTVAVQAGEHAGFTRLVIPIGPDRDWRIDERDGERRLALDPPVDGFDLSRAFDLIPRTRIAGLQTDDGALVISLACDCAVSSFRHAERHLVIDIADGPPDGPEPEAAGRTAGTASPAAGTREPVMPADPIGTSERTTASTVGAPLGFASITAADDRTGATGATLPLPVASVEEAARIMAEQLARAAAAGLLDAAAETPMSFGDPQAAAPPPDPDPAPVPPAADPLPDPAPAAEPRAHPAPLTAGAPEVPRPDIPSTAEEPARTAGTTAQLPEQVLRIRNAFDIARAGIPDPAASAPRLSCTGEALGIAEWSDGGSFASGLGSLRQAVFDERDRINAPAAIRLARHYLHHGFGAEAEFWLRQVETPDQELIALAHLIDGTEAAPFDDVQDDTVCSDEEYLIRYLARATGPDLTDGQAQRLQRGFVVLPAPLRLHFGPSLAQRLAADGHAGTARNVRDNLARSGGLTMPQVVALDLDIGTSPELPPEVVREAVSLSLRDDGAAPGQNMARALSHLRATGEAPDPTLVTAAEAVLREIGRGAEADALWREVAIARARMGQVDAAIGMLQRGRGRSVDVWQATLTDLIADRLDASDDAALLILAHLFGTDWTQAGSDAGRLRVSAAQRLDAAGLPEAADRLRRNGPGLILPRIDGEGRTGGETIGNGTVESWPELARDGEGALAAVARRMARATASADPTTPPEDGRIDLERLAAQIEDTRQLRDEIGALMATPAQARTP